MADIKIDVDNADVQNRTNEEFEFHDIPYDTNDNNAGGAQTHIFHDNPDTAESDEDEFDKTELLKEKSSPSFWKFEYYQQFFDVDTYQVLDRIVGSMVPKPRRNYLKTKIRPNPDLYGPFWICTTLVFTTAIAGNLANYLQSAEQDYVWRYDFHKVTFSATAIFAYWWLVPAGLVALLWWRKSDASYTFLEILCVYGYSLAIYIPISILWVIQVNWLQWTLVIIGALLSGSVLLLTFWPAVRDDVKQIAWITMGVILVFHAALAVGFVLYFFHVPAQKPLGQSTPAKIMNHTNAQKLPESANRLQAVVKPPQADQSAQPGQQAPQADQSAQTGQQAPQADKPSQTVHQAPQSANRVPQPVEGQPNPNNGPVSARQQNLPPVRRFLPNDLNVPDNQLTSIRDQYIVNNKLNENKDSTLKSDDGNTGDVQPGTGNLDTNNNLKKAL